jgi:hypothetical protein
MRDKNRISLAEEKLLREDSTTRRLRHGIRSRQLLWRNHLFAAGSRDRRALQPGSVSSIGYQSLRMPCPVSSTRGRPRRLRISEPQLARL